MSGGLEALFSHLPALSTNLQSVLKALLSPLEELNKAAVEKLDDNIRELQKLAKEFSSELIEGDHHLQLFLTARSESITVISAQEEYIAELETHIRHEDARCARQEHENKQNEEKLKREFEEKKRAIEEEGKIIQAPFETEEQKLRAQLDAVDAELIRAEDFESAH
jgi:hypothetical protein